MSALKLFMIADHCASLRSLTHADDFDTLEVLNDIRWDDPNETLCEIASNLKYFYGNKNSKIVSVYVMMIRFVQKYHPSYIFWEFKKYFIVFYI